METPIAFLDSLGSGEMLFLGVLAILLFGEQLPDVARSWGKKFVEFKRSVQGIKDELRSAAFSATSSVDSAVHSATDSLHAATDSLNPSGHGGTGSYDGGPEGHGSGHSGDAANDFEAPTAPKFEPPKAPPANS